MPTLHCAVGWSLAPHIAPEWIGASFEAVKVGDGPEDFLAARPFGILDGGRSVTDACALPVKRRGAKLLPDGLTEHPKAQAPHDRLAADRAVRNVPGREAGP